MPQWKDFGNNPVKAVSDLGSSVDDLVNNEIPGGWATVALLAAGYYYAPEIGAYVAADGAATIPASEVAALDATGATTSAVTGGAAGAASGVPITTAATGAATVPGVLGTSLTATQIAQLAKLGVSAAGLLGGAKAASSMSNNSGGGGLLTQQDRSGFSSGTANYSPEYYQQVQAKYNQYMPQAKGADITTDLKNWYETKYTPGAATAGTATPTTTGTGYTTPTSMTNLGIKPQTVTPKLLPSVAALTPTSSATDVAKAFSDWSAANGGNTEANRSTAITYLRSIGIPDSAIQGGYSSYLSALPASTGTTATTLAPNASAAQIAQAYGDFAKAAGGDTVANRSQAITYLRRLGIPDATIQAAYPIYQSSIAPQAGSTGMLTGAPTQAAPTPTAQAPVAAPAQAQPLYATLGATSNPQAIADAYRQFLGSTTNDTAANQQAANQYLTNLGISQDTIGQAYGLFKGA